MGQTPNAFEAAAFEEYRASQRRAPEQPHALESDRRAQPVGMNEVQRLPDETEGGHPLPALSFKRASDLDGKTVPEMEWLVEGVAPMGKVTGLNGDGGTGKSLVAKQLAIAVASGGAWLGRKVKAGNAIYFSAEDDDDELHRRIDKVARHMGVTLSDLTGLTYQSFAGKDATLAVIEGATGKLRASERMHALHRWIAAEKPALVVLDTLADLFPGNENDRAQARQFVGMLAGIAIKYQCAVLLLAHPSLSGLNSGSGTSGSTGWNNSVRSRLYLERVTHDGYESNPDARVLRTMKNNYGRIGGEINVTWRDGVFVADAVETGLDRMATGAKAERVFLKLLRTHTEQGRRVNDKGGNSYAPKAFAEHPQAEGVTKRAFKSAMEALLADGKVQIGTEGPASRRVNYLIEVSV